MKKDNQLIPRAMRAFEKAGFRSGKVFDPYAWWPLNFLLYTPLFMPRFAQDLCSDYALLRKSCSLREIGLTFQYPTAVWLGLLPFLSGSKLAGLKKKERVKIALEFLQMLEILMPGNIFCEDGRNLVWEKTKVEKLLKEINWVEIKSRPDFSRLFARLHCDLLSLDEAIFWNANCATREVHGPYKVKWKNTHSQLIVREYYNLSEPEFLPPNSSSPYKSVTSFTIYHSRLHFDFPVLNDYTHDLPLPENTLAVLSIAERNGQPMLLNQKGVVIKVCRLIEEANGKIASWGESLSKQEQVIESVKRYYYRAKPIRDLLGKRWQAPQALLRKIKKEFSFFQPTQKRKKMSRKQFYAIWDPRIDS